MATINTNVHALFSQTALKSTERSQQVSMQQLSSGTRINSSRDDAAGLSITSRMTPQIHSVNHPCDLTLSIPTHKTTTLLTIIITR